MKKNVLLLWLMLSTALLVGGGNLTPIEPVEQKKVCHKDLTYVEEDVNLMWQDQKYTDVEDGAYARTRNAGKAGSWKYAVNYCRTLYYAGYSDWRLPTADELHHMHGIIGQAFTYFRDKDFWTSTPTTEGKYYVVYPADAYMYKRKKTETNFIRCVRCIGLKGNEVD